MNKFRIGILDDEKAVLSAVGGTVKEVFSALKAESEIFMFTSAKDFLHEFLKSPFELVLLDIDIRDGDGIDLAAKLRKSPDCPDIIFVSNREERVFDSFEALPFGFIRKSRFLKDISRVLTLWYESYKKKDDSYSGIVELKTRTDVEYIKIKDIIYIESLKDYQKVHLYKQDKVMDIHSSMNDLEEHLKKYGFIRIHKSYIVNSDYIEKINDLALTLSDGETLFISRKRIKEVREEYMNRIRGRVAMTFKSKTD